MTSDGGLILVRELDERFGLSGLIGEHLVDSRTGRNRQFPLADLLRQSVYSRLAGLRGFERCGPAVGDEVRGRRKTGPTSHRNGQNEPGFSPIAAMAM